MLFTILESCRILKTGEKINQYRGLCYVSKFKEKSPFDHNDDGLFVEKYFSVQHSTHVLSASGSYL